jgi:hypothetical protein
MSGSRVLKQPWRPYQRLLLAPRLQRAWGFLLVLPPLSPPQTAQGAHTTRVGGGGSGVVVMVWGGWGYRNTSPPTHAGPSARKEKSKKNTGAGRPPARGRKTPPFTFASRRALVSMRTRTAVRTALNPAFNLRRALKIFNCPIVPVRGASDTTPVTHGCAKIWAHVNRLDGSTT